MSVAPALRCSYCGGGVETGDRRCKFCRSDLATVRCASCFAICHVPANVCGQCGEELVPEAEPEPTDHRCPRCDASSMAAVHISGHAVIECLACTGVFVTHATLEDVTVRAEAERAVSLRPPEAPRAFVQHAARYLPCPVCRQVMTPRVFANKSGIIVDICKTDGVWFDRDELSHALDFVASGGLADARKREADAAEERARSAARSAEWPKGSLRPDSSFGGPIGETAAEIGVELVFRALIRGLID